MADQPTPPSSPKKRVASADGPGIDTDIITPGHGRWSPREIAMQTRGPLSNPADLDTDVSKEITRRMAATKDFERRVQKPLYRTGRTVSKGGR